MKKLLLGLAGLSLTILLGAAEPPPNAALAFRRDGHQFVFDTGVIRGKLKEQRTFGLTAVEHSPTGRKLSRGHGLFGIYRVFSDHTRYGAGAWDWPGEAVLQDDGAVLVRCAPATERPFELTGLYRWVTPGALDLEITVKPQKDLRGFEAFLASYFDPAFSNALAYVQAYERTGNQPGLLAAERSLGNWLMFPRDSQAVSLVKDGRWQLPPHPVEWTLLPPLAGPLGVRRAPDSGLTALLMAPARDCFAVACPYETEGHFSTYLSLFGRDLKAGETARARARLVILEKPDTPAILKTFQAYHGDH